MLHGLSWEGGPGWPKGNTFSQPNYQSDQGPCFISPDWWRIFWCLRHLVNFDKIWRIGNGRNILENSETDGLLKAVLQRLCLFGTRFVKRASTDQETDGNLMLVLLQNIRTLHLLFIHVAIATHFPWTSYDLFTRPGSKPEQSQTYTSFSNMPIIQRGHQVVRLRCYACHLAWGIAVVNLSLCRASTRQGWPRLKVGWD